MTEEHDQGFNLQHQRRVGATGDVGLENGHNFRYSHIPQFIDRCACDETGSGVQYVVFNDEESKTKCRSIQLAARSFGQLASFCH